MAKQKVQNDPDFKIKGDKTIVQARSTPYSIKKSLPKFNKMRWISQQQKAYNLFLIHNKELFSDSKHNKIFCLMSKKVITRDARQCKTHHAKMLKKNKLSLELLAQNCLKKLQSQKQQLEIKKQEQQKLKPRQSSNQLNFGNNQLTQQLKTSRPEIHLFVQQSLELRLNQDLFSVLNLEHVVQQQNPFLFQ